MKQYDFEEGKQLLGIYGRVAIDKYLGDQTDKLLSLGFFRDECSATRELYRTQEDRDEDFERKKRVHGTHTFVKVLGVILIMFMIFSTCCMCYCGLKNRGKCCFKKT